MNNRMMICLCLLLQACGGGEKDDADLAACQLEPDQWRFSEVMAAPLDQAEWVELHYSGQQATSLQRAVIEVVSGDQNQRYVLASAVPVDAGSYVVIGDSQKAYATVGLSANGWLPAEGATLRLLCRGNVIAQTSYGEEQGKPVQAGRSLLLDGLVTAMPELNANDSGLWCSAQTPIEAEENHGSPGQANESCGKLLCRKEGNVVEVAALEAGALSINEVLANPIGADRGGEWLELRNETDQVLVINGLTIGQSWPTGQRQWQLAANDCLTIGADELRVIAFNEGLANADLQVNGDDLSNQSGELSLAHRQQVLDTLVMSGVAEGRSLIRDVLGGEALCLSRSPLGRDQRGTPGLPNDPCGLACRDAQGKWRRLSSPTAGDLIISEIMSNPQGRDKGKEWLELSVKNEADLNGLQLLNRNGESGRERVWRLDGEACLTVSPGQRVVLQGGEAALDDDLKTFTIEGLNLFNQAGELLLQSETELIDSVPLLSANEGVSQNLDLKQLDAAGNDLVSAFCPSRQGIAGTDERGTPGRDNEPCGDFCLDEQGWRELQHPLAGEVTINEVMSNPAGRDGDRDWFELEVTATRPVDLNDLRISQFPEGGSERSWSVQHLACLHAESGGLYLLGAGVALDPSSEIIELEDFELRSSGTSRLRLHGAETLDEIVLPSSPDGEVYQKMADGQWCFLAGDGDAVAGTPGQVNHDCP